MNYPLDAELVDAAGRVPAPDLTDVATARAASSARRGASIESDDSVRIDDAEIGGIVKGSGPRVRVYRPDERAGPLPGLLHLHSGGFVMGSIEAAHARNVLLAAEVGAVVVAVDYRLAPEHPYPAALDDAVAALRWLVDGSEGLGVDRDRIAVHGRSAGAGLAAALTLRIRDEGGPRLCFQYLAAPQLDDRTSTASMRRFTDTPMWSRGAAQASWRHYLGAGIPGSAAVPPYAAPARAKDLSGLPPAYIAAMEFDPMRDEALAYARALADAGVPVEVHLFPGTFHCSAVLVDAAVSRRELDEERVVLREALRRR
ncbi:alpha/beta hydrolase fold domain-containing protein [Rhodococcus oxybenzonivorans]|uniref:alpha/beta hydrolase fold domain-containing protein n=1 Tax=Rhodococcus oxybenzonivorans TaxID=1990687 RepID=UPI0029534A11|nr:alpha/beta hydrolase fold domain-containing protein [Rhodococcus oxybenzonivorans]MDV7352743.1 alpha/beta hydrolase fold domain-containing protein [Rhodococcus oxybenzonivorans]